MKECSWCRAPASRVGVLIAGPSQVYICDACVAVASERAAGRREPPPPLGAPEDLLQRYQPCSFCLTSRPLPELVAGPGSLCICDVCLVSCRQTLQQARPGGLR
ncbi:MAG: hypothetical protein HY815_19595 [Candidatus Riflebacteria bacterium]|nr:hypothetical protein [Candidatus Riflebacteria bacterium]